MARRRSITVFNISFLDIMSCGFGAVVLLFLIIKHNAEVKVPEDRVIPDMTSEVSMLNEEITDGQKDLAQLRNTIAEISQRIVIAQGLARRATDEIKESRGELKTLTSSDLEALTEKLKQDVKKMEQEKDRLAQETENTGANTRSFVGEGNRQYLTGLKLGGSHILVLLDASASMLDKTIVNVIRRRNMSDKVKRASPKWQRMLKTVDWLSTRFPVTSKYQIYTFNTEVTPVIKDSSGQWLDVGNKAQLDESIKDLKQVIPAGGTSLERAFEAVSRLRPAPDNIYLITDGLPTQGDSPPRNTTVSGRDRLKLFENALKTLPQGIPVNIILAPMEGDPMAASAFWQLAQISQGSFISPAEDWP